MKKNRIIYGLLVIIVLLNSCSSVKKTSTQEWNTIITKLCKDAVLSDTTVFNQLAREHIIQAAVYQQQYRYADAIIEYQEALRYDSSHVIMYLIAKNYTELNKFQTAKEYLFQSIAKDSTLIPALELLSDIVLSEGKTDEALSIYKKIQELEPKESLFYKTRMAIIYETTDIDKAIEIYESVLDSLDKRLIIVRLSELYKRKNDNVNLARILELGTKVFEGNNYYINELMFTYLKIDSINSAMKLLDTLDQRASGKDIELAYGIIGNWLAEDNNPKNDIYRQNYIKRIDNRFISDWSINLISGFIADGLNDTILSEQFYNKSMKNSEDSNQIIIYRTTHYLRKKAYTNAITLLENYEQHKPQEYIFPFYLGISYFNQGQFDNSIKYLHKSLLIDNDNIDVLTQLGLVFDRINKMDSSDYYYQKALEVDNMDPLVNNNYAYSLTIRGKELQKALEMSSIAIKAEPTNASYLDTYSWVNYMLGEYNTSLVYIKQAIEYGAKNSEVYEHLAEIYIKLGKVNEAIDSFEKALVIEPENERIINRLQTLKNK